MKTALLMVAGLAVAAPALAGDPPIYRGALDTPFFPGDGNDNVNFAISRVTETGGVFDGNTVELGIKAKERWFGDANIGGTDDLYIVQAGYSPTSGAPGAPDDLMRAWWNFDFSFDYGSRSVVNTLVTMTITDIEGDVLPVPFVITPGFLDGTESLVQASWNTGFDFLSLPLNGFDPFQLGDYRIDVSAVDVASNADLGSIGITVRVVPSAPTGALLGAAGLLAARRRR